MDTHVIDYDSGSFDPSISSKSRSDYGNERALISNIRIVDLQGRLRTHLKHGLKYRYRYDVEFYADATDVSFGMMIKNVTGLELAGLTNENTTRGKFSAGERIAVVFDFVCAFLPGFYLVNAGVLGTAAGMERAYLHRILDAVAFRVDAMPPSLEVGIFSLTGDLMLSRYK